MKKTITMIEEAALSYERGKMLREDSEVEIDVFDDGIYLCDYSEERGSTEPIKKLCDTEEVSIKQIETLCDKYHWAYVL